jgi:hypothetical protein
MPKRKRADNKFSQLELSCFAKSPWADFLDVTDICNARQACLFLYEQLQKNFVRAAIWNNERALQLEDETRKLVEKMQVNKQTDDRFKHQLTHAYYLVYDEEIKSKPFEKLLYLSLEIGYGSLPASVTHLRFGSHFNLDIKQITLPSGLRTLEFGNAFNEYVMLPPTLTKLTFGCHFNISFENVVLPESLLELELGENYTKNLNDYLPSQLRKLTFHGCFAQEVDQLPQSVQELVLLKTARFSGPCPTHLRRVQFKNLLFPMAEGSSFPMMHSIQWGNGIHKLIILTKTHELFVLMSTMGITFQSSRDVFKMILPHLVC